MTRRCTQPPISPSDVVRVRRMLIDGSGKACFYPGELVMLLGFSEDGRRTIGIERFPKEQKLRKRRGTMKPVVIGKMFGPDIASAVPRYCVEYQDGMRAVFEDEEEA